MLRYPIVLTQDDNNTLLVTSPDFPELKTFGEDEADAALRAADALISVIAARIADRQPVPKPSATDGAEAILGAGDALKIALYQVMNADGVDAAELAKRLRCELARVEHLLDPLRISPLDQLETALRALGRDLTIVVGKAA